MYLFIYSAFNFSNVGSRWRLQRNQFFVLAEHSVSKLPKPMTKRRILNLCASLGTALFCSRTRWSIAHNERVCVLSHVHICWFLRIHNSIVISIRAWQSKTSRGFYHQSTKRPVCLFVQNHGCPQLLFSMLMLAASKHLMLLVAQQPQSVFVDWWIPKEWCQQMITNVNNKINICNYPLIYQILNIFWWHCHMIARTSL